MKGCTRIGSTLLVPFLLERWILATSFKEVEKRSIQMAEGLLQRNTRNRSEPCGFFLFFEVCQRCTQIIGGQSPVLLIVRIRTQAQSPIVDIAATPKGLSKDALLFVGWVKPILVSSLLVHELQYSSYLVNCQPGVTQPRPPNRNALVSLALKGQGFTGGFDKNYRIVQLVLLSASTNPPSFSFLTALVYDVSEW